MAIPKLFILTFLIISPVMAQLDDFATIPDWVRLLKAANDIGMSMLKESRDMNILGYQCHFNRDAGWHRFKVKYDGTISCPSIGQVYSRSACNSKGCAWKEPFMLLIRDFIANNRAPKDGLVAAIQGSELQKWEKQNLYSLVGVNIPPVPTPPPVTQPPVVPNGVVVPVPAGGSSGKNSPTGFVMVGGGGPNGKNTPTGVMINGVSNGGHH